MVKNNKIKNTLLWLWQILVILFAFLSAFISLASTALFFISDSSSLGKGHIDILLNAIHISIIYIVPIFTNYLIFKLFGTFKFLDEKIKNTLLEILFLFLISALDLFTIFKDMFSFKNIYDIAYILYFLFLPILSYLIYKLIKKLAEKQNKNNKMKNILLWLWQILVILFSFISVFITHIYIGQNIYSHNLSPEEGYLGVLLNIIYILIAFTIPIFINYLIFKLFGTFKFLDKKIKNVFTLALLVPIIPMLGMFDLFEEMFRLDKILAIFSLVYFSFLPALSYLIYKIRKKLKKKHKLLHQAQPVNKDKSA